MKKLLVSAALSAIVAAGSLVAFSAPASAYVVCDRDGDDCWHSDTRYRYPGAGFTVHPDDWYFHRSWDGGRDHWRSDYHRGRGYWRGGVWVTF